MDASNRIIGLIGSVSVRFKSPSPCLLETSPVFLLHLCHGPRRDFQFFFSPSRPSEMQQRKRQ